MSGTRNSGKHRKNHSGRWRHTPKAPGRQVRKTAAARDSNFLGAKENYAANMSFLDFPLGNQDALDEVDGLNVLSGSSDLEAKSFAEGTVKPALQTRALLSTHACYRLLHGVYVLVEQVRGTSSERQTLILKGLGSSVEITEESRAGAFQTAVLKLVVYVPAAEVAGKKARKHAQSYLSQLGRVLDGARLAEVPPQELVQRLITFGGFQATSEIARAERRSLKTSAVKAPADVDEDDDDEDDWAPSRGAALNASQHRQLHVAAGPDEAEWNADKSVAATEAVVFYARAEVAACLHACAGKLVVTVDMDFEPPVLEHFLLAPSDLSAAAQQQFANDLLDLLWSEDEDGTEGEDD